jgi:AcrR family transcriptional regulator
MTRKVVTGERREDIIKGLYRSLTKKSFHETTIKDIAAETPCSYGIIHYHFKSKEEILFGLIDYLLKFHYRKYLEMANGQGAAMSSSEKMDKAFNYISNNITKDRELNTVFLKIISIALNNDVIRRKIQELYLNWFKILESSHFNEADTAESFHKAISLIALHEGLSVFSVILDRKYLKDYDIIAAFRKITGQ